MKLIDANVLIYALGKDHEYRDSARVVTARVYRGELDANVDVEGIQEVIHYYHSRGDHQVTLRIFDSLLPGFPQPVPVDAGVVSAARNVLGNYPFLQVRDAFHAAVVFQHNLEGIISADRAFDKIDGLKRFDPKELAA